MWHQYGLQHRMHYMYICNKKNFTNPCENYFQSISWKNTNVNCFLKAQTHDQKYFVLAPTSLFSQWKITWKCKYSTKDQRLIQWMYNHKNAQENKISWFPILWTVLFYWRIKKKTSIFKFSVNPTHTVIFYQIKYEMFP
jgi:hypothetical protein